MIKPGDKVIRNTTHAIFECDICPEIEFDHVYAVVDVYKKEVSLGIHHSSDYIYHPFDYVDVAFLEGLGEVACHLLNRVTIE